VLHGTFSDLDPGYEQAHDLRCQLVNGPVPFCLLDERLHIGGRRLQLFQPFFLLRDRLVQLPLLGVVVGREKTELLVGYAAEHIVLVQPLEQGGQLVPAPAHGVKLLLQHVDLLPKLRRVFAVDVLRKLPLLLAGEVCHPPQIVQYDGVQLLLPDVVGRAFAPAALAVGVALEIVVGLFHTACPVQHHRPFAVGTVGKSRKEIRLVHVLRRTLFVSAHLLHDIPLLFPDQREVRVLHNGAFAFGAVHRRFVLVGYRCGAQSHGVPEIDLVVKDSRDGAAAPRIGAGEIQLGMALFVISVIIIAWRQHLFLSKNPGDLIGTFAGGAQREDSLYHRRGFVVGDELLALSVRLFVAVGRPSAEPLSPFCLQLLHRTNLLAGILCVKLVCPVAYRTEIVAPLDQRIDTVVDRYEPHAHVRKEQLKVIAHLQILSAEAAEILDDQCFHLTELDHIFDLFPRGTLER